MGELGLADNAGVKIFYASTQVQKLPPGHRFPMGKYEILRARLDQMPEIERVELAVEVAPVRLRHARVRR